MKLNKALPIIAAAIASPTLVARAFSTSSPVSNRVAASALPKVNPTLSSWGVSKSLIARGGGKKEAISTTSLSLFDKLFGGGGGGYSAKIDYTAIPYPVPELAELALAGDAGEEMVRNGKTYKLATFAGGCFWGFELHYQRIDGVDYSGVGYTQGPEIEPTYDQVCSGGTKHTEAIIVLYDPTVCSYERLLDAFFERIDPLTVNGQGNDRGTQYRTGVYYHSKEQQEIAEARFAEEQKKYKKTIASECMAAMPFWPAEKYHQQYLEKGGRFSSPQSAEKGCTDTIRCYG
jgi:peptide-methionine (S)-S-oxide reductase